MTLLASLIEDARNCHLWSTKNPHDHFIFGVREASRQAAMASAGSLSTLGWTLLLHSNVFIRDWLMSDETLVSWRRKTTGEQMDQGVSGHYWCTKENGTEALRRGGTG